MLLKGGLHEDSGYSRAYGYGRLHLDVRDHANAMLPGIAGSIAAALRQARLQADKAIRCPGVVDATPVFYRQNAPGKGAPPGRDDLK